MMGDDGQPNLAAYSLKGIQLNGEDVFFGQYLAKILDLVLQRVKSIPPFKRKVLDLQMVLDTLDQIPSDIEKDYMSAKTDTGCPLCGQNPLTRANHYAIKGNDHPTLKLDSISIEEPVTEDIFSGSTLTLATSQYQKVFTQMIPSAKLAL